MACALGINWETKVTKLLLADFDGRAKFNNKFRTNMFRNNLMKGGVSSVQGKLTSSSRFLVFEKEGRVKYVSVSMKDATICCKFRKSSALTCRKENCSDYHLCKFFVSGNCTKGSSCHFGHDLQNEANAKVSERLGMSSFSADEIRIAIFRSNPAVCVKYNAGGCDDPDCPDLHVCSFFMRQKCKAGNGCKLEHSLQTSEHNKWVLDTFCLGHLTDVELRKYIIVQNILQAVSKKDAESQPQMTQAASSLSLVSDCTAEVSEEETEEYILSVFSFLLRRYGGRTKFNTFLCDRGKLLQRLGREDIIEWFKDYSDQFLLYEKDGEVTHVAPFNRRAKTCFFYSEPGTLDCKKESCKYFHVCRAFVAGVCLNSSKCGLCHSFCSGPNSKVLSELKLEQFSDSEVCKLVLCSNPAVCLNHNASSCNQKDCPDLHVCSKYILKKCTSGDGCKFSHKMRDSEHNRNILKTFRMEAWLENVLGKIAIVKGEHKQTVSFAPQIDREIASPCTRPAVVPRPRSHQAETATETNNVNVPTSCLSQKAKTENDPAVSELVKDTEQQRCASPSECEYICEMYTWTGVCSTGGNCPRYHSPGRLPYLWMIQLGDTWQTLNSVDNVQLETSFCSLHDVESFVISLGRLGKHSLSVDFRAMSAMCTSSESFTLRRLSTPSYVTSTPPTPLSFYTQWLWYRRERTGTYTPFYPGSLQYTLEEKYLKGQNKYYFEFEDLRLLVNTHTSKMVQVNLDTQGCTRIVRRPVFVLTDESEPPLLSSLLLDVPPPLPHQVPDHWSVVDHFQDFEVVELGSEEEEFRDVYRQFFSTMREKEFKIANIFRVQNPGLWDKYCSVRRAMTPRGERPEDVDERQLFHGTPTLLSARGICANSFDFRRAGENVGAVHGKGAYFSTTAHYSHSYTRTADGDHVRFMFLGRILVGQYTLGHPSYSKPPERDRLKLYDSCVNDMTTPTIFVIFDMAQSYPEYLIHYLDASDVADALQTSPRLRPTSAKLLSTTTQNTTSAAAALFPTRMSRSLPGGLNRLSATTATRPATSAGYGGSLASADSSQCVYPTRSASTVSGTHAASGGSFTPSRPQNAPLSARRQPASSAAQTHTYDRVHSSNSSPSFPSALDPYRTSDSALDPYRTSDSACYPFRTSDSRFPSQHTRPSPAPLKQKTANSFCIIS